MKKKKVCAPSWKSLITVAILLNCCAVANSQTTAFTYQGKLTDGGAPANAIYDLEFKLFDDITGGTQVGTTLTKTNVQAVSGVFSVELDFGPEFSGADRYLEMSISLAGQGTYTTLSPRKKITSAPHSMRSINAAAADSVTSTCSLCIMDAHIQSVSGSKIAGAVPNADDAVNAANLGGLPSDRYVRSDANGHVGIGAAPGAGSTLTVGGQVELTNGAIKFPDATTQSSAGISSVTTMAPLAGDGTPASPIGIHTPLMVVNTDNPTRQPFYVNTANNILTNLYTVPAGKRLVIEHVSGGVRSPSIQGAPYLFTGALDNTSGVIVLPETSRDNGDGTTTWYFSSPVRTYLAAGKVLSLFINGISSFSAQEIRLNGHFVDVP